MSNVAYIIDQKCGDITIYVGAKPYSISNDHMNYSEVIEKLKTKQYEGIEDLLDIPAAIIKASNNKVIVENGSVYYNGKKVHNVIVDRILQFINEDLPFEPLVLFLENLLKNESESSIEELYLFLESGNMPITDDGCFLAYKKVDNSLNSFHVCPDGTYLNHEIGKTISMPRKEVDNCRDRTCSSGLHFCALSYLRSYYGGDGRVVILKINPKDVVSIPSDYNNAKGRASCYQVIAEYKSENREEEAFSSPFVDTSNDVKKCFDCEEDICHCCLEYKGHCLCDDCPCNDETPYGRKPYGRKPNGNLYHNVRGSNGRFVKRS